MPRIPVFQQEVTAQPGPIAPEQSPERVMSQQLPIGELGNTLTQLADVSARAEAMRQKLFEQRELLRLSNISHQAFIEKAVELKSADPFQVEQSYNTFADKQKQDMLNGIEDPVVRERFGLMFDQQNMEYRYRVLDDARSRQIDAAKADLFTKKNLLFQSSTNVLGKDRQHVIEEYMAGVDALAQSGAIAKDDAQKEKFAFLKEYDTRTAETMANDKPDLFLKLEKNKQFLPYLDLGRRGELTRLAEEQNKKKTQEKIDGLLYTAIDNAPAQAIVDLQSGKYDEVFGAMGEKGPEAKHKFLNMAKSALKSAETDRNLFVLAHDVVTNTEVLRRADQGTLSLPELRAIPDKEFRDLVEARLYKSNPQMRLQSTLRDSEFKNTFLSLNKEVADASGKINEKTFSDILQFQKDATVAVTNGELSPSMYSSFFTGSDKTKGNGLLIASMLGHIRDKIQAKDVSEKNFFSFMGFNEPTPLGRAMREMKLQLDNLASKGTVPTNAVQIEAFGAVQDYVNQLLNENKGLPPADFNEKIRTFTKTSLLPPNQRNLKPGDSYFNFRTGRSFKVVGFDEQTGEPLVDVVY